MAKSTPIPGSTGEVLTGLPSPYMPHAATGLLYLPRMIAKCRYVQAHGELPQSYRKNYKRGLDRFLSMHLGVEPAQIEAAVHAAANDADRRGCRTRQVLGGAALVVARGVSHRCGRA